MPVKPKVAAPAASKVKPAGKTGTVKAAPKVAAAKVAPAAKPLPEPKYPAGSFAIFKGYTKPQADPMFTEPGVRVFVHSTAYEEIEEGPGKGRKVVVYYVCPEDQAEVARNDPEMKTVTCEQLKGGELKPAPEPEPEYHPVAHASVAKLVKSNQLTPEIKKLREAEVQTEFQIGGLLAFVKYERFAEVTELGYADSEEVTAWEAYLRGEFNISLRTAEEYIKIYRQFSTVPDFDPKVLVEIGWSKAALVAGYVPQEGTPVERREQAEKIVETARNTDIRSLRDVMKSTYVGESGRTPAGAQTGGGRAKRVRFGPFMLVEEGAVAVQMILEHAGKQRSLTDNPNALFETIVREWGTQNLTGPIMQRISKAAEQAKPAAAVKPAPAASGAARKITPRVKPAAAQPTA